MSIFSWLQIAKAVIDLIAYTKSTFKKEKKDEAPRDPL